MGRDVITAGDIEAVCTTQITNHIFDMIKAVTEKKQKRHWICTMTCSP